jgi:hypothetical protein
MMRWLSFVPGKSTLILLFLAAKRRVADQTEDLSELSDARIVSATEELNRIADDVRDAQESRAERVGLPAPARTPEAAADRHPK